MDWPTEPPESAKALAGALSSPEPALRSEALDRAAALPLEAFSWPLGISLAGHLLRDDEPREQAWRLTEALARRGANLVPLLQLSLQAAQSGPPEKRAAAQRFLGRAAAWSRRRSGPEPFPDLPTYASHLVDLLLASDRGDASEHAADLLVHAARMDGKRVSISLFIRWPDPKGPLFVRFLRRLRRVDPELVRSSRRERPEQRPLSLRRVVRELRAAPGPFLVARGQYAPSPARAQRVGILQGPVVLFDGWVVPADVERLAARLGKRAPVRLGEWDVMYATGWGLAWTADGAPFDLWDSNGRVAWQDGGSLRLRSGPRCLAGEVECVQAYLEDGWNVRGVRVALRAGGRLPVAEVSDPIAGLDPTYDGLNLMFEAGWTVSLARALGGALGVKVEKHPDL